MWSPDGTRIAFRGWEGGTDSIVVVDAGGGNRDTGHERRERDAYCARGDLAWSPDGTSLVFADQRGVRHVHLTCSSSRPTGRQRLTGSWLPAWTSRSADFRPTAGGSPSWAVRAGSVGRYVADVGMPLGGGLQAVGSWTARGVDFPRRRGTPQWSPDGTELALGPPTRGTSSSSRPTARGSGSLPNRRSTRPGRRTATARVPPHRGSLGILRGCGRAPCASGS